MHYYFQQNMKNTHWITNIFHNILQGNPILVFRSVIVIPKISLSVLKSSEKK